MKILINEKEKKCPLCGSENTKVIYSINAKDVASLIDNDNIKIKNEIIKIWSGETCRFMNCKACSFSFASPFKGGTNKLYSLIYTNNYPTDRWEYNLALKDITAKDICLEIGAGQGLFLKKIYKKCKKENIYSVEISNDKSNFKTINDVPDDRIFSVICMFQVLEHLANFKETMKKIDSITKDNAKLIISVPHESSIEFFRKSVGMSDNPPIHVSRWNKKTIEKLNGWEIENYQTKSLNQIEIFKNLFYSIRTIRHNKTRNPLLLLRCFISAIIKMKFKKIIESQYFCLRKVKNESTN